MSYNASNNLQSVQYSGNQDERLGYDSNEPTDSSLDKTSMPSRKLDYGYMDKVLQAKSPNGEATFLYDADGRLVGKRVQGAVISFIWDGSALAAEGAHVFTNEAHAVGGVSIIAGNHSVVISDYLGSTLSEGSRQFHGSAYGEGLESARFTGKPFVEELGNFVFPHRLYSPALSRWTTSDPSGHPDGINNVIYGGNDPATNVDPTGLTFSHFTKTQLNYQSGSGYGTKVVDGQTVGKVTMGDTTTSYAAVSNNDDQDQVNGMSPNGWYTLGNKSLALAGSPDDEKDRLSNGVWTQGTMSQWSGNNGALTAADANSVYQNLGRSQWKIGYGGKNFVKGVSDGAGFISGRLMTGNTNTFVQFSARNYVSLKVHPDGNGAGTSGCIGISTRADSAAFIANLATYGGKELYIAEQ